MFRYSICRRFAFWTCWTPFRLDSRPTEPDARMKVVLSESDITIPEGVKVEAKSRQIRVTGPRGVLTKDFRHVNLELQRSGKNKIHVVVWHGSRKQIACIRTVCSEIQNMIKGVSKGYEYKMRFVYAHFPINVNITDDGKTVEIRNFIGEKLVRRVHVLEGGLSGGPKCRNGRRLPNIGIDNRCQGCAVDGNQGRDCSYWQRH